MNKENFLSKPPPHCLPTMQNALPISQTRHMPRHCNQTILLGFILILIFLTQSLAAFNMENHQIIINLEEAQKPSIIRDNLLFSYATNETIHSVSIAFKHESYQRIYPYMQNEHGVFFFIMPLPKNRSELEYRIIVDGIWITDPLSQHKKDQHGIKVSFVKVNGSSNYMKPGFQRISKELIRFVYHGEPGSNVSLAGNFNKWDPYITPMTESRTHPGIFVVELNTPEDILHYRFVVNGESFLDPANRFQAVNGWGKIVSAIR